MRQELSLQSVRLDFLPESDPAKPSIEGLFDWYIVDEKPPDDAYIKHAIDGGWYWEYSAPKLRHRKSQTTIGLICSVRSGFDGKLRFRATFNEDVRREYLVPFVILRS